MRVKPFTNLLFRFLAGVALVRNSPPRLHSNIELARIGLAILIKPFPGKQLPGFLVPQRSVCV